MRWAAIVLAGGRATRLGGIDKPGIEFEGSTLLARAVTAVAGADPVVVVGATRPLPVDVVWTVEENPGSGPVAALAAGLAALPDDLDPGTDVVLLAADLPRVSQLTVARLRTWHRRGAAGSEGALLVDADGREQWLMSAWRLSVLRKAMPKIVEGKSLHRVLGKIAVNRLPAADGETDDVDTPDDLDRLG